MRNRTHNPTTTGHRAAAFTLVELLVVITIIGILLGTLVPTLSKVRADNLRKQSQAVINQVHGACRLYHSDHDEYPSSAGELVTAVATSWRKVTRGTLYGPYNGADTLSHRKAMRGSETDPAKGSGPDTFHDAFGNPVLYYRFREASGDYDQGSISSNIYRGIPPNINAYLRGEGGNYHRADFVLMTAGADGKWEAAYAGGKWTESDDQSNFLD